MSQQRRAKKKKEDEGTLRSSFLYSIQFKYTLYDKEGVEKIKRQLQVVVRSHYICSNQPHWRQSICRPEWRGREKEEL